MVHGPTLRYLGPPNQQKPIGNSILTPGSTIEYTLCGADTTCKSLTETQLWQRHGVYIGWLPEIRGNCFVRLIQAVVFLLLHSK